MAPEGEVDAIDAYFFDGVYMRVDYAERCAKGGMQLTVAAGGRAEQVRLVGPACDGNSRCGHVTSLESRARELAGRSQHDRL